MGHALRKRSVVSCACKSHYMVCGSEGIAHPLLCTSPLSFGDFLALPCCRRSFDLFQPTYIATEETTGERKQAVSWPPAACKRPELGPTMSLSRPYGCGGTYVWSSSSIFSRVSFQNQRYTSQSCNIQFVELQIHEQPCGGWFL